MGSYELERPHKTAQILTPSQLSHSPLTTHTLSLLHRLALTGSVEQLLSNTTVDCEGVRGELGENGASGVGDIESVRYLWTPSALRECLSRFRSARSHSQVSFWLDHMMLITECCRLVQSCECETSCGVGEGVLVRVGGASGERSHSGDWEEVFGK